MFACLLKQQDERIWVCTHHEVSALYFLSFRLGTYLTHGVYTHVHISHDIHVLYKSYKSLSKQHIHIHIYMSTKEKDGKHHRAGRRKKGWTKRVD